MAHPPRPLLTPNSAAMGPQRQMHDESNSPPTSCVTIHTEPPTSNSQSPHNHLTTTSVMPSRAQMNTQEPTFCAFHLLVGSIVEARCYLDVYWRASRHSQN